MKPKTFDTHQLPKFCCNVSPARTPGTILYKYLFFSVTVSAMMTIPYDCSRKCSARTSSTSCRWTSSAPTGAVRCHLSPTTAGQWSTPSPVPVMMTGSNQDLVCRRKKFGNVRFVAFDYYNAEAFTFVTAAKEDADDFKTGLSFFQKK